MRYVQRNEDGVIVGDFACEQEFTNEALDDDHPELLEFYRKQEQQVAHLKAFRVANSGPTDVA